MPTLIEGAALVLEAAGAPVVVALALLELPSVEVTEGRDATGAPDDPAAAEAGGAAADEPPVAAGGAVESVDAGAVVLVDVEFWPMAVAWNCENGLASVGFTAKTMPIWQ